MAYIGVQPTDTYLSIASQQITGTGSATYTLDYSVSNEEDVAVFVNNVRQNVSSYTVSGTSLTLGGTISASDSCWILFLGRTVGTKTPAVGSVTNDMLAGSISPSKVSNLHPYKNRLINGDMSVAQRGTSSSSNGYVSLDRWYVNQSGGSTTFSQETNSNPSETGGLQKYARLNVSSSSDYTGIRQPIEDVTSVPEGTITISFYAKGTAPTGGLYVSATQHFGSGGPADVVVNTQITSSLTSSWVRYSAQLTLPSIDGITIGAGSYLAIFVGQYSNSSSTAYDLNITGIQAEVGTSASNFEFLPYDVNLKRCERYYQILQGFEGSMRTSVGFGCTTMFRTQMRSAPSVTQSGALQITDGNADFTQSSTSVSIPASRVTTLGVQLYFVNFSGLTQFRPAGQNTNVNDSKVGADAEL